MLIWLSKLKVVEQKREARQILDMTDATEEPFLQHQRTNFYKVVIAVLLSSVFEKKPKNMIEYVLLNAQQQMVYCVHFEQKPLAKLISHTAKYCLIIN